MEELFVQKQVREFLKEEGFGSENVKISDLRERGVDIKVKKERPKPCGWYYLVECKGDPREKVKSPSGSRSSSLNSALGQIISRMHTDRKSVYGGYYYGVAFPVSFKKMALRKIPYYVCNRLKLSIFIVNKNGKVDKYDYKKLKKLQTKKH